MYGASICHICELQLQNLRLPRIEISRNIKVSKSHVCIMHMCSLLLFRYSLQRVIFIELQGI
jgi:hypothetical protein